MDRIFTVDRATSIKKWHACDFSEKGLKKDKKGKNVGKFGQKCTKFENVLKKGSLMRAPIALMKKLEYALVYICFKEILFSKFSYKLFNISPYLRALANFGCQ